MIGLKLITLNEKPSAIPQEVFWAYAQGFDDAKETQAKLTIQKVIEWSEEICPHVPQKLKLPKRECSDCWEELRRLAK
jgi:hypothetical protein